MLMNRGRPVNSQIRQNMVEILHFMGKGYGYEIYRHYRKIFPQVTLRSIYYHLSKGVKLNIFKIATVQKEKGEYSWGGEVEKTYYELDDNAKPTAPDRVKNYFDSLSS